MNGPVGHVMQTRLLLLVVLATYTWIIYDVTRAWVLDTDSKLVAFMLLSVVAVILFGAWAVRLRPAGMYYVFLIAGLLQMFAMVPMLIVEWHSTREVVYLSSLLMLALLYLAFRSRREGRILESELGDDFPPRRERGD